MIDSARKILILGDVKASDFCPWIIARANKLGLTGWVSKTSDCKIEAVVCGPPDLVDAMEIACSLGPASVIVDTTKQLSYRGQKSLFELNKFVLLSN